MEPIAIRCGRFAQAPLCCGFLDASYIDINGEHEEHAQEEKNRGLVDKGQSDQDQPVATVDRVSKVLAGAGVYQPGRWISWESGGSASPGDRDRRQG